MTWAAKNLADCRCSAPKSAKRRASNGSSSSSLLNNRSVLSILSSKGSMSPHQYERSSRVALTAIRISASHKLNTFVDVVAYCLAYAASLRTRPDENVGEPLHALRSTGGLM